MIGIYDSGIGGLGIFNAIKQVLPTVSILYYGDTYYFPFGNRNNQAVQRITVAGLKKLESRCSIIVIACNTASVNDLDYYRKQIAVPLVGVVPVIKTAAQLTKNNQIALLATSVTVAAEYTDRLIHEFAKDKIVKKIACGGLASQVEYGPVSMTDLEPYKTQIGSADIVVLGCTHYSLIKGLIQRLVGPDVMVIDSNEAVARQTLRVMQQNNLPMHEESPTYIFECSGDKAAFLDQVKKYAHL
jgi:glutamate racemase